MTRYDIAKFYGYNSPEEYDEAQRRLHESFVESKKMQKTNAEKEPVKIQPVKRGYWEEVTGYYRCSVCGEEWYLEDGKPKDNNMNFCPRCGARMDGEQNG